MSVNSQAIILTKGHIGASLRFLRQGLPRSGIDNDQNRLVIGFYCLATLDILGAIETATSEREREEWRNWLWAQQVAGSWGSGFRGSPYAHQPAGSEYDPPFLIMTYAALLALAILRDPLILLDRKGLLKYLKISQRGDGSFKLYPTSDEYDLRMTFCAFSICSMLDDWSSINIPAAVEFLRSCRTYEGGYGQEPFNEAHGGSTYCALASLHLLPVNPAPLTPSERAQTARWLVHCQEEGFCGRTNKLQDACYCFWCAASLDILGNASLANGPANTKFLLECQFRYGGVRKDRESNPGPHTSANEGIAILCHSILKTCIDPYHTYLGLASLNILAKDTVTPPFKEPLDPLWNAGASTKRWIKECLHKTIPA